MTPEQAVERVLQGAWDPCLGCATRGFIPCIDTETKETYNRQCAICDGKGYLLVPSTIEAFEMTGTPIPNKPLTPREQLAKAGGDFIRERMNRPSPIRNLFVPQLSDEEDKKP